MDYFLIVTLLSFFAAYQLIVKYSVNPVVAASVAVGIPYLLSLVILLIQAIGYKSPIFETLFSLQSLVLIAIQFALCIFLFRKIQSEESVGATIGWCIGGFIVIIIALPFVLELIF